MLGELLLLIKLVNVLRLLEETLIVLEVESVTIGLLDDERTDSADGDPV